MGVYQLNKYEQETIINYNNGGKEANIYTCDRALMRKLDKLCEKHPEMFRLDKEEEYSKSYWLPRKLVAIRPPRILTEEQRQKLRDRSPFKR
jgi:hypothetical protein